MRSNPEKTENFFPKFLAFFEDPRIFISFFQKKLENPEPSELPCLTNSVKEKSFRAANIIFS